MAIRINLDVMLARRKMSLTELSRRVGISLTSLSLFKTGKLRGLRFSSLDAICVELDCQPGDILEHVPSTIAAEELSGGEHDRVGQNDG